jgi:hypothetical protein
MTDLARALIVHPLDFSLLQFQSSCNSVGNSIDPCLHRSFGVDEKVRQDGGKADGRYGRDPAASSGLSDRSWSGSTLAEYPGG